MTKITDTVVAPNVVSPLVGRRPFPALTSLRMIVYSESPSPRLMNILHHISSAPELASIVIKFEVKASEFTLAPSIAWDGMDKWLACIAKSVTVGSGLVLTPRRRLPAESIPEGFLPEFREAGGEVKMDQSGWGY